MNEVFPISFALLQAFWIHCIRKRLEKMGRNGFIYRSLSLLKTGKKNKFSKKTADFRFTTT
jgi:hypothetical protein